MDIMIALRGIMEMEGKLLEIDRPFRTNGLGTIE
jgi:hypothetical protein